MIRVAEPAAAVTFLTRLPLGRLASHEARAVAAAAPFFPITGAAVLLATAGVAHAAATFVTPLPAAALAVAFLAAVTGALHLDALADAADALGGSSRADRLRIMHDHAIGAFGATALCLTLLLETAAVAALLERHADVALFVAIGAASRGSAPLLAAILPYARDGSTSSPAPLFTLRRGAAALAVASVLSVVAGVAGLLVYAAALVVTAAVGESCRRGLGGVTGDTLGASIQLTELAGLTVAVALS